MSDHQSMLTKIPLIAKVIELVLAIFCVGLITDPFYHGIANNLHRVVFVQTSYNSYIIINVILLLGYIMKEPMPKKVMVVFPAVGGILFLIAGALVLNAWTQVNNRVTLIQSKQYMDMAMASGVIAIFNTAVFFADAGLTAKFA